MFKKIITVVVLGAGALVAAAYFRTSGSVTPLLGGLQASQTAAVAEPYVVPALGETYSNAELRFSITMPEGFNAQELPVDENGVRTIVLQDAAGNGIQILVTPAPDAPNALSADDVRANIPDMAVSGEQPVEIGAGNVGVAFLSDNEAFGGASREVWFYFRGNLYQISTYARLDSLLQTMFGTWKFF